MTKITVSTKVHGSLEHVREVRTNPIYIMQWNAASDDWHCPAATNDLRVDWIFSSTMAARDWSMSFEFAGKYDEIIPMKKIAYTLGEFEKHRVPAGRKVEILFDWNDDESVEITVIFDAEEVHSIQMQQQWRQAILDRFKGVSEND